jgi:hypothetical protein
LRHFHIPSADVLKLLSVSKTHHAEGLVDPKVRADFGYLAEHVDSENIKLKIGSRAQVPSSKFQVPLPTFFKM